MLDRTDRHPGPSEAATIRRRTVVSALAVGFVLVAAIASTRATGALAAKPSPSSTSPPQPSLTAFVTDPSPWLHLEPNSQQRSPIYLGSTPRELALGLPPVDGGVATLPGSLKALGELQLKNIRQSLSAKKWITATQIDVRGRPVIGAGGR